MIGPRPWGDGRRWIFRVCPWNSDHQNRSAYLLQFASGVIAAGCHHNGCSGKNWHALRDLAEPGWKEKRGAFVGFVGGPEGQKNFVWPDPQPIPDGLPPVEPFREKLLPEAYRPWVMDNSERMQCPPDFAGAGSMVATGAVVGRKIGIRPKRKDDWQVVPNLWGCAIGRSGIMKTPAMEEILKPLKRLNAEAEKFFNDTSVEKLGEILAENPNGILVFRDELTGWLRSLDREGQECSRAFYLEAWNGTGSFYYDRIGRGTILIPAACVSILGGIQPGPLADYMREAVRGGKGDDGLIQRLQLAVYPDAPGPWRNVDRWPNSKARDRVYEVFKRLDRLDWQAVGAVKVENDIETDLPFLHFEEEAQELFDKWRGELEARLRSGDESPAFESHLAKYRSLIPSLALLIHLIDDGTGPVSHRALLQACAWGEYLESHARRIYCPAHYVEAATAKLLAKQIQAKKLSIPFTARDVYRHEWSGLATENDVMPALELLEDLDWLRSEIQQTGGRPKTLYHVNPKVWGE